MKKAIIIILGCVLAGVSVRAQTFAEFFEQKKTQIKYLEQQIAALEAYIKVTEQGYKIVQQGTKLITDLKKGDFDLHSGYFSSFRAVNPSLAGYSKVTAILDLNDEIVLIADQVRAMVGGSAASAASASTLAATARAFFDGMLRECGDDLAILQMLVTDGQVQMTDQERMVGIDGLYGRMQKRDADAIRGRNDVVILFSNLAL